MMSDGSRPLSILQPGQKIEDFLRRPTRDTKMEEESDEEGLALSDQEASDKDPCLVKGVETTPTSNFTENIFDITEKFYHDAVTGALLTEYKVGAVRSYQLCQEGVVKYECINDDKVKRLPWWWGLKDRVPFKPASATEQQKQVYEIAQMWWADDGREPWARLKWMVEGEWEVVNWDDLRVVRVVRGEQ